MSFPANTIPEQGAAAATWAWIGLGANLASPLGSPRETVRSVMAQLQGWSREPARRSSLWVSEPLGCPPGSPEYVNAVIGVTPATDMTPHKLLQQLLELEGQLGRRRSGAVNEPRCVDLDLISFGDCRCRDSSLILPHPEAHRRAFVLFPLAEVAPSYRLPGQTRTVAQLCASSPVCEQQIERIP